VPALTTTHARRGRDIDPVPNLGATEEACDLRLLCVVHFGRWAHLPHGGRVPLGLRESRGPRMRRQHYFRRDSLRPFSLETSTI
jgi:hypothetical protein